MIPGEMFIKDGDIELNAGRKTMTLTVANSGDDNLAFPSGHTAFLTAFALALALLAAGRFGLGPTSGTALALAAASAAGALMGWAQVATGAHYPTDTVGGCCTALAVVPAAAWVIDRAADSRRRHMR